jgi:hypothetical protein
MSSGMGSFDSPRLHVKYARRWSDLLLGAKGVQGGDTYRLDSNCSSAAKWQRE